MLQQKGQSEGHHLVADSCRHCVHAPLTAGCASQFIEAIGNFAKVLQYRGFPEITQVRVARAPESERSRIERILKHQLGAPDRCRCAFPVLVRPRCRPQSSETAAPHNRSQTSRSYAAISSPTVPSLPTATVRSLVLNSQGDEKARENPGS